MPWYIVLFDAQGTDDYIHEQDGKPSQRVLELWMQSIGYLYAGCFEAETEQDAIKMAEQDFEAGGCVS